MSKTRTWMGLAAAVALGAAGAAALEMPAEPVRSAPRPAVEGRRQALPPRASLPAPQDGSPRAAEEWAAEEWAAEEWAEERAAEGEVDEGEAPTDPDQVVGLGYAWGEGSDLAWQHQLERLRSDEDAGARLAEALSAQVEVDGPMARSLVVALGEVGGEDAIAALAARVEAPAAGEEGLVTRLMALESLARAQVRTGGLAQVGDLHHRLAGMVADRSLDLRQRMLAAQLWRATTAR